MAGAGATRLRPAWTGRLDLRPAGTTGLPTTGTARNGGATTTGATGSAGAGAAGIATRTTGATGPSAAGTAGIAGPATAGSIGTPLTRRRPRLAVTAGCALLLGLSDIGKQQQGCGQHEETRLHSPLPLHGLAKG